MSRRTQSTSATTAGSLLLLSLVALTGCGTTSTATPATPTLATPATPPTMEQVEATLPEGTALLMAADVTLNLDDLSYTMEPLRRSTLTFGQEFPGVNLTGYLAASPCSTCLRLESIDLDPEKDLLSVSMAIRHPFPAFPDFPRKDLDAFDVKGIMLLATPTIGAYTFNSEVAPGVTAEGDVHTLINADGYTPVGRNLWTDSTFLNPAFADEQSTLNPFRFYQSDGLERRFRQGASFEARSYTFDVSRIFRQVRFLFAVVGNYATPIRTIADRPDARYFVPWFNQKEAYLIEGANLASAPVMVWKDASSQTTVEIKVADHQRGLASKGADLEWDDPANTLAFPSNVADVTVEIPAISDTPFTLIPPNSGTGTFADPFKYNIVVTNTKAASFGTYPMLIKTRDQFNDAAGWAIGKFTIPYDDDFDFENAITETGWVTGAPFPGTGAGWSVFASGGGNGKYWDDNNNAPYENNVGLTLDTPVFDLTFSSIRPVFEITHQYDLEPQFDGGAAFLSIDGGFSFDYSNPIPVLSGRDYDNDMFPKTGPFDVLAYKPAFTGDSEGNALTQFDLTKAAGKKGVVIRFVFSANSSGNGSTPPFYQGWSIYRAKMIP